MSLRQTGRIVTMRLTAYEYAALRQRAAQDEDTVSEMIREALYQTYGIGGFAVSSLTAARAYGRTE